MQASLSLGNLVLSAPQTSRVESPGGVGVKVGGLDSSLGRLGWAPPHDRVLIPKYLKSLTQLLWSRVLWCLFVSQDWEQPGSSGLGMPQKFPG